MSKTKAKENNHKGFNVHYEARAEGRLKQHWIVVDRTGEIPVPCEAPKKGAKGAIPVHR